MQRSLFQMYWAHLQYMVQFRIDPTYYCSFSAFGYTELRKGPRERMAQLPTVI